MPLVATSELLADAHGRRRGLGAFNVITLEHAEGIVRGAERAGKPVVLQISQNALRFHEGRVEPLLTAVAAVARSSTTPASIHLDHIEDDTLLQAGIRAGASSAMFDASKLAYRANVQATRIAADWAHSHGVVLEAELGEVGGKDGAHAPGVRTDPDAASGFVAATGADALAVAVGSSHAMSTRTAHLDFHLIRRLAEAVPVPLVLHGSSGVADADIARAVEAGITKINVGTILNSAFTRAIRAALEDPAVVDPRKYLAPARDALAETVRGLVSILS